MALLPVATHAKGQGARHLCHFIGAARPAATEVGSIVGLVYEVFHSALYVPHLNPRSGSVETADLCKKASNRLVPKVLFLIEWCAGRGML